MALARDALSDSAWLKVSLLFENDGIRNLSDIKGSKSSEMPFDSLPIIIIAGVFNWIV